MPDAKPIPVSSLAGAASMPIPAPDAFSALTTMFTAATDLEKTRQLESTKRELIAAQEKVQVERIRAAESVLKHYFEHVFAERAQASREIFARLDQALETGDPQLVQAVVTGIVELAKASPLAGLEDFGKFWADHGTADRPFEL